MSQLSNLRTSPPDHKTSEQRDVKRWKSIKVGGMAVSCVHYELLLKTRIPG